MKTSSVSLKSILSTSGLVLSLISSSFKTSSGSSSKNIIFSISRRLRILFLKPNSNWNREGNFLLDLLLTCSWDSLQLWFWGGRLSHFWFGHTYNWLVDCQHTWDLPQRDRPLRFEQGRCWSGPGGSEKKIQEGSHILANYTKYTKHQHQHHLSRTSCTYDCNFGLRGEKLFLLQFESNQLRETWRAWSFYPNPFHLLQENIQW